MDIINNLTKTKINKRPTILIVDDSKDMIVYTKSILANYNTVEASNGLEALQTIQTTKIDLLITDYQMPKMNGLQLLKNIKE